MNGGSMELFDLNGVGEVLRKLDINVIHKLPTNTLLALNDEKPEPTSKCMYGISFVELTKVNELHVSFIEIVECKGFAYGD
jgi:hypothetical protein